MASANEEKEAGVRTPKVPPTKPIPVNAWNTGGPYPMAWTFADGINPPEGGDQKFMQGQLKGRTFLEVTYKHPEQYFATRKSKTLSAEAKVYVAWVNKHYKAEGIILVARTANTVSAGSGNPPDPKTCPHIRTNHQGSNRWFHKTYCIDCKTYIDAVERDLAKTITDESPPITQEEVILQAEIIEAASRGIVHRHYVPEGD
jgi:hypothetical protein